MKLCVHETDIVLAASPGLPVRVVFLDNYSRTFSAALDKQIRYLF